jgi:hypothetical protein
MRRPDADMERNPLVKERRLVAEDGADAELVFETRAGAALAPANGPRNRRSQPMAQRRPSAVNRVHQMGS